MWYPVQRHIEFECYRTRNSILYRDETGLHECIDEMGTGFFTMCSDEYTGEIPVESYPIVPTKSAINVFWTRRPFRCAPVYTPPQVTHQVLRSDMTDSAYEHVDIVSDAAVHVDRGEGAVCWHAVAPDETRLSASRPIEVPPKSYSYRHELIGIYDGLKFTNERRPHIQSFTCHCDNKSGIDKLTLPIQSPGDMMRPDMDVVMAIKEYVFRQDIDVDYAHVKGHADRNSTREACTRLEQINIDCDEDAEQCVQSGMRPDKFFPLPGSKCMVKYGNRSG